MTPTTLLLALLLTTTAACEVIPFDAGPLGEAYICHTTIVCHDETTHHTDEVCDNRNQSEALMREYLNYCLQEETDLGCPAGGGCSVECEGKGVTEGDGILRLCTDDDAH